MEKTIRFEHSEMSQMAQIEQERIQALAQIGALMMDLETVKKQLETINERNKAAVRKILSDRGIDNVVSVRPIQGGLVATLPEEKRFELVEDNNNA